MAAARVIPVEISEAADDRIDWSTPMNTMQYKHHTASIEHDERDNIFVGRVLGIQAVISFHGETTTELRQNFETAIDDFLNDSQAQEEIQAK
jgi:predicted HicB family RNase H-like nuclease